MMVADDRHALEEDNAGLVWMVSEWGIKLDDKVGRRWEVNLFEMETIMNRMVIVLGLYRLKTELGF